MTKITEVWVDRENLRATKIVEKSAKELAANEILVTIDKFALTANNVTYAVLGDAFRYWDFYPAQAPFGVVPVWAMADVIGSNCPDIEIGERLWGFFPMASHATLTVGNVRTESFKDVTAHRRDLPVLYNHYARTRGEPDFLSDLEDERCLLFPLFGTAYVIYDFLLDNEKFGAEQIIIGSASSKTGFGLAKLLNKDNDAPVDIIGVTAPPNVDFVSSLTCFDTVVAYGDEAMIDANRPTVYVDMSGNRSLTETLHHHLSVNLVYSCMVGLTHWEGSRNRSEDLPGAKPTVFFAPAQIAKRNQEWGPGVFTEKTIRAFAQLAEETQDIIEVERISGADNAAAIWRDLLDNNVASQRGILASIG
ncbi:MAG: DUF2855 family protein [Pseudomonadota bacterium]